MFWTIEKRQEGCLLEDKLPGFKSLLAVLDVLFAGKRVKSAHRGCHNAKKTQERWRLKTFFFRCKFYSLCQLPLTFSAFFTFPSLFSLIAQTQCKPKP